MLYLAIGGTYLLESFNLQPLASQNVMETSHAANTCWSKQYEATNFYKLLQTNL